MQIQAKCEASSVAPNVAFVTMVMSEVGEQVFGRKPNLVRKKKRVKVCMHNTCIRSCNRESNLFRKKKREKVCRHNTWIHSCNWVRSYPHTNSGFGCSIWQSRNGREGVRAPIWWSWLSKVLKIKTWAPSIGRRQRRQPSHRHQRTLSTAASLPLRCISVIDPHAQAPEGPFAASALRRWVRGQRKLDPMSHLQASRPGERKRRWRLPSSGARGAATEEEDKGETMWQDWRFFFCSDRAARRGKTGERIRTDRVAFRCGRGQHPLAACRIGRLTWIYCGWTGKWVMKT
jgi:hypothetical protein